MSGVSDNKAVSWADMAGQPKVCWVCGEKIALTGKRPLEFRRMPPRSRHLDCEPKAAK